MKKIKFKRYTKLNLFLKLLPKRILSFKRPKWKKLQLLLTKTNKKNVHSKLKNKKWKKFSTKTSLLDYRKKKKLSFFWEKNKKAYKNGLLLKNSFKTFFDNSYKNTYIKKQVKNSNKNSKSFYLLRFLLRFDVLLWKLNLVKSSRVAKILIRKGVFFVNDKKIYNPNYILQFKDIVTFDMNKKKICLSNIKRVLPIEIDYYTNSFILSREILVKDLSYIFNEYIPLRKISSFILKN